MSDQSDFVADPVAFMKKHVVRCQFMDTMDNVAISESRPLVITVRKKEGSSVVGKRDAAMFYLTTSVAGLSRDEKLPIFWLGYKDNDASFATLTNASPVMFTANMDGCTLGIGSQGGDGACYVSHANMKKLKGGEAQRAGQEQQLRDKFGADSFRMLQPAAYQATSTGYIGFKATNFGINRNGTWVFYTHKWNAIDGRADGRHLHGGCEPARPVPPVPVI